MDMSPQILTPWIIFISAHEDIPQLILQLNRFIILNFFHLCKYESCSERIRHGVKYGILNWIINFESREFQSISASDYKPILIDIDDIVLFCPKMMPAWWQSLILTLWLGWLVMQTRPGGALSKNTPPGSTK